MTKKQLKRRLKRAEHRLEIVMAGLDSAFAHIRDIETFLTTPPIIEETKLMYDVPDREAN